MGQKENSASPPKKRGTLANLRKGKGKSKAPRITTAQIDNFCLQRKFKRNPTAAAIAAGFSPSSVHYLLNSPKIQERMKVVDDKFITALTKEAAEKFVLDVEVVDAEMLHILVNGKTHFMRGDADRVKAGETIYKRLKLIDPPSVTATATAGAQAAAKGNTVYEVYKSKWQIEKEERMRAQIEAAQTPVDQSYGSSPDSSAIPAKTTGE